MADPIALGLGSAAVVGIYANLALTLQSSFLSSPQTTEVFAKERWSTLWKWVKIAGGAMLAFGIIGSLMAQSWLPLLAVGGVAAMMTATYALALKWGTQA